VAVAHVGSKRRSARIHPMSVIGNLLIACGLCRKSEVVQTLGTTDIFV